jgi:hypothetical protein
MHRWLFPEGIAGKDDRGRVHTGATMRRKAADTGDEMACSPFLNSLIAKPTFPSNVLSGSD